MKVLIGLMIALSSFTVHAACSCRYQDKEYIEKPNYQHWRKKAVVKCNYNCVNESGVSTAVSYIFKKSFFKETQGTLGCKGVQYTYDQLMRPKSVVQNFNPMMIVRRIKYRNLMKWAKKNNCPGVFSLRTYTGTNRSGGQNSD